MLSEGPVTTLVEAITAQRRNDRVLALVSGTGRTTRRTFAELYADAARTLAWLTASGLRPGDELVLLMEDYPRFVGTFWACLLGGIICVPVSPPTTADIALRIHRILDVLASPWLMASAPMRERLAAAEGQRQEPMQGRMLDPPTLDETAPLAEARPASADDIAFIQFSSGSTGQPKGVVLTHANLLANIAAIKAGAKLEETDRLANWMPLTHDFGIIWFHIMPMVLGLDHALIPTPLFVRNPQIWLRTIDSFKATVSAAPNFAYRHLLKHLRKEMRRDWRLDSLRLITNGAEPISVGLARSFEAEFAGDGLRAGVITAAYGLAEGTLLVTMAEPGTGLREIGVDRRALSAGDRVRPLPNREDPDRAAFAEVGRPAPGVAVRIAGQADTPCDEGIVGRIQIRGPCVTPGYYRNEQATRAVMTTDGWLDTGDLGFIEDGSLCVTGRRKDVVILGGANYYPPDIERAAADVPGLDLNMVLACAVPVGEGEGLALFALFRQPIEQFPELARQLRDAVVRQIGVPVDYCLPVTQIPRTTSGKVQRYRLAEDFKAGVFAAEIAALEGFERSAYAPLRDAWRAGRRRDLLARLGEEAGRLVPSGAVAVDQPLMSAGMTSLRLVELVSRLNTALDLSLAATFPFEYPTLEDMAEALLGMRIASQAEGPGPTQDSGAGVPLRGEDRPGEPIAVIGIGCRLPNGIDGPDALWKLLAEGRDTVGQPPAGRWPDPSAAPAPGSWLADLDLFDHRLFQLSPAEAAVLDPQQRLLLMVSWQAFEDAGIDPLGLRGSRTAVFTGITNLDQARSQARAGREAMTGPYAVTGVSASVASGRLSFVYGLAGPNLAIDTACSSGLVAAHQAMRSLRAGECDLALAAAVNLILVPDTQLGLQAMNALSPDGRCKAFDAHADGYGRGEGCVVLVMKRLADAVRDDDRVLGLLQGSAVNHDGRSSGLTAPNGAAQQAVLRAALADSGLAGSAIDYVEAHGTGTPLGDPIEANALGAVFGEDRPADLPLLVGSVKTNIGHLEATAGLAGLVKLLLALEHGRIPPSLHFSEPNPTIPWSALALEVTAQAVAWTAGQDRPRRAGVSAFGFSGTNVHVIVEEAAVPAPPARVAGLPLLLPLSARSDAALAAMAKTTAAELAGADDGRLVDLAYTLATGRAALDRRIAVVGRSSADLAGRLEAAAARPQPPASGTPEVIFAFPGQGSQMAGIAGELLALSPIFRDTVARADAVLAPRLGRSLTTLLAESCNAADLARTGLTQPVVVALGVALAAMLEDWGIRPTAVLGHSVGEIAAAIHAGAIAFESGLVFAAERGRLMEGLPEGGAMAAVVASEDEVRALLDSDLAQDLAIAAFNAPNQLTISGPAAALSAFRERASARHLRVVPLAVSHAFHSPLIEPALPELARLAAQLVPGRPRLPVHSTLTGGLIDPAALTDPDHWLRHARQPVRFAEALGSIPLRPGACLIELGARPALGPLAAQTQPDLLCLPGASQDGLAVAMLDCAAALFIAGTALDWPRLYAGIGGRRVRAPGYAFVEPVPAASLFTASAPPPSTGAGNDRTVTATVTALPVTAPGATPRPARLAARLVALVAAISGLPPADIPPRTNWFGFGLDSLLLVQIQHAVNREFGLALTLADLLKDGDSVDALAGLLDRSLPAEVVPAALPPAAAAGPALPGDVGSLMAQQVEAMSRLFAQQLDTLKDLGRETPATAAPPPAAKPKTGPEAGSGIEIKGLFRKMPARRDDFTGDQIAHFDRLAVQYGARTKGSKDHTQRHRGHYANPRAIIGFRPEWKEMTYPLTVERAEGAHVFDVDGNRYVDITMGFGAILLGHTPPFVAAAITAELGRGAPLGPQSPKAGELAAVIAELTGVERVAFFTTGSEAVMVAVRLARSVTGRRKIVLFTGAYHGTFDGVLAAGWADGDSLVTIPVTDGTPQSLVDDTIVLRYGDPGALDRIRAHAQDIAAVLVEPVQSRDPALQPHDFLHALRGLTRDAGIALIFDEVILGFRVHPGGAQAHFGIEADMVTYGKIVGGGLPIGVVAGRRQFLDAVDGGAWSYGDDSLPAARTAFVAGTFNGHALSMAAGLAVLDHLRSAGPRLQQRLNERTAQFCAELDGFFAAERVPIRMAHFSSLFRFEFTPGTELLNTHLLNNGVFVWEGRNCFLSTAHDDADLATIVAAVRHGVAEMRRDLMIPVAETPAEPDAPIPLSQVQREIFFLAAANEAAGRAYHEMVALDLQGPFDAGAMDRAVRRLAARHQALGMAAVDGETWRPAAAPLSLPAASEIGPAPEALRQALAAEIDRPFDLAAGPLLRLALLRRGPDHHCLALTAHHIAVDGWSLGLLTGELGALYGAERQGQPLDLPPAAPFGEFVQWAAQLAPAAAGKRLPPLDLPALGAADDSGRARRLHRRDPAAPDGGRLLAQLKRFARDQGASPFAVLLAAFTAFFGRLAGQGSFAVGMPYAGHAAAGLPVMVGQASVILPIPVRLDPALNFAEHLRHSSDALAEALQGALDLMRPGTPVRAPITALVNMDRGVEVTFDGLTVDWVSAPAIRAKHGLFLNLLEFNGSALFDFDCDGAIADAETAELWFDGLLALLAAAIATPQMALGALPMPAVADRTRPADRPRHRRPRNIEPPATAEEARLAAIWAEALGLEEVGVTESFFDLGGHSLAGLAILSTIERQTGRRVPIRLFFEGPSVRALAAALGRTEDPAPAIRPTPEAADYPASNAQARLWMLEQLNPGLTAYNVGIGLWSPAPLDPAVVRRSLARLAERHESLRTALIERDGLPRQKIAATIALPLAERAVADRAAAILEAQALAAAPFDLAEAPLWRALHLKLPNQDCLLLVLHHSICDVWSMTVLVRDFVAFAQGADPSPLPIQFRDYAAQPQRPTDSDPDLAYWRDQLAGPPAFLTLPSDHPRPAVKGYDGARVRTRLSAAMAERVRALAADHGTSLFVVLAAALKALLHHRTGESDLTIGTVVAGREQALLDDQIGFFVNTLPLRDRIDPKAGFDRLVAQLRRTVLEAFEHQAVPFEQIVEALPRDTARNPLFEIMLVMDDRQGIRAAGAPLGLEPFEIELPTAQFDVTLYVTDEPAFIDLHTVYNSRLFKEERIAALMADFGLLLDQVTEQPETPVAALASTTVLANSHQERLWFVDRFERGVLYPSGPTYYNMPLAVEIAAGFDGDRLRQALAELSGRHPALRTAFLEDSETPLLRVARQGDPVPLRELSSVADPLAAVIAESQVPFRLATAPLCRAILARRPDGSGLLALAAHHAVTDPVGLRHLLADLLALTADPAAPPPAPATEPVTAVDEAEAAAYWHEALAGAAPLVLPTDRPRPGIHLYEAGRTAFTLPAALLRRLDAAASERGLARCDLLRAAFQTLLHRLSGQSDIVHGEPLHRAHFPANLLVLRSDPGAAASLAALAARGRVERAAAERHGAMAFDRVVLAVKPQNDMSRTALFDVLFDDGEGELAGLADPSLIDPGLGWGKYDLVLCLRGAGEDLSVSLVFNRLLFDDASADRIAELFRRLAEAAANDPDAPLASVDLLGAAARFALAESLAVPAPQRTDATIPSLFRAVAAARGEAIAVTDGERQISYRQLDRAAQAIAARLRAAGIGRDSRVGVIMERGAELIAAFLGILDAGAAYVPIDPELPPDRIRFVIADAGLGALCVAAGTGTGLQQLDVALPVVAIDRVEMLVATPAPPAAPGPSDTAPEDLAYVIYTSGSTGQPKGVAIEHRNVVQLLFKDGLPFRFDAADVWTLFHSPSFDFSVWEMYGALLFGGRLVVVRRHQAADPAAMVRLLAGEGVTVLNQTPTAFQGLSEAALAEAPQPLALRLVIFGGEALQPAGLARWRDRYPAVRLVNMYGITETTVHVTWAEIGDAEIATGQCLIGRPLPTYGLVLVDTALRPVPDGLPGEICVTGPGLGRGYLNRPELTAERFLALPDFPGRRFYRSGDLAWRRGDGALIYLGRRDDQVKIRGFRIELAEIERQLLGQAEIRQAVVLPEPSDGGRSLTAWLVAASALAGGLNGETVHRHLGDKLPAYMIPSRFVELPAIPLTRNGKIDRRALGGASGRVLATVRGGAPATDGLERTIATIWQEILGGALPGREDNFFLLGGHSLQANQAVVRLRRACGCALSLKDFFSAPSLGALATLIRSGAAQAGGDQPQTITRAEAIEGSYPLSPAQRRLWLLQSRDPRTLAYNMVGAFRIDGALDRETLARAFAQLLARHEVLRSRFVERRGEPRQVVLPAPAKFALPSTVVAAADLDQAIDRVVAEELRHVFDLGRGPLLRARLIAAAGSNGEGHYGLVLNMHHIVADGWSVTVLLNDLARLYGGGDLPPLPVQYKDYAAWQTALLADGSLATQRAYWHARFEDEPAPLDLPLDRPRAAQPSQAGALLQVRLEPALAAALEARARAADCSLFMLLLAILQVQLHALSGADEVVIGTPVAGRNHVDLEAQIGFYLNLLPLRLGLGGASRFSELLASARAVALDAFAHQDYPFDRLVEELAPVRIPGRQPLFDLLLILQNNDPPRLALPGARTELLRDATVSAKYDLNYMFERDDGLSLTIEYATELFDAPTVERFAAEFQRIAAIVAVDGDASLAPLLAGGRVVAEAAFLGSAAPAARGEDW